MNRWKNPLTEIVEELEAALEQSREMANDLGEESIETKKE